MRVILTEAAELDLEEIGDWIAQNNPLRAATFIAELREACEGLAANPLRFQLLDRGAGQNVRRRPYGNYLIFYRVRMDSVRVLRVLHGARDYEPLLFPEDEPR